MESTSIDLLKNEITRQEKLINHIMNLELLDDRQKQLATGKHRSKIETMKNELLKLSNG